MRKIVTSVGLAALGASALHGAGFDTEGGKPWSAQLTLRGFYDSNFNTSPNPQGSTGFEVSPAFFFNYPWETTSLDLSYVYSFKYYDKQPAGQSQHYSQANTFNIGLSHSFNERTVFTVRDSFVIGQEPDILRAGNTFDTFQRIPGDNMRNYGSLDLAGSLNRQWGYDIGYDNTWFSYADDQPPDIQNNFTPSNAGLLNRIENGVHVDAHYQFQPQTIGVFGVAYRNIDYTADQAIGGSLQDGILYSDVRNANSYYAYVGVDHTFRPDLSGSLRAGARYNQYYNNPYQQNAPVPYLLGSIRWTYGAQSYLEGGLSYDSSATSSFSVDTQDNSITLDTQTFSIFAAWVHRITPKLFSTVNAQFQDSTFNGGLYNNQDELFYLIGLNLQYRFNRYAAVEVGYNWDHLDSQVGDSFYRNRVYIGVTGTY